MYDTQIIPIYYFVMFKDCGTSVKIYDINASMDIGDLRKSVIRKERFEKCPQSDITLWKVTEDIYNARKSEDVEAGGAIPLGATEVVGDVWKHEIANKKTLCLAVQVPKKFTIPPTSNHTPSSITERRVAEDSPFANHRAVCLLYKQLWNKGNIEDYVSNENIEVPGLQDPDETTTVSRSLYDLSKIGEYETNIVYPQSFYLREEYREFDAFIAETKVDKPTLLTGHPGNGKSVYLVHCLLKRLSEGKPTHLMLTKECNFLFVKSGVFHVTEKYKHAHLFHEFRNDDSLALFDMNCYQWKTSDITSPWRTLVASEYCQDILGRWVMQTNPYVWYMKTWSWEEAYVTRHLATNGTANDSDEKWREAFQKFGGSARHLLFSSPLSVDTYVGKAIASVNFSRLLRPFRTKEDYWRYVLVQENPRESDDGKLIRSDSTISFISRDIVQRLLASYAFATLSSSEKDFVFQSLNRQFGNGELNTDASIRSKEGMHDWHCIAPEEVGWKMTS